MRSDLALIDPASRQDSTRVQLAARRQAGVWRDAAGGGAVVSHAGAGMVCRRRLVPDARDIGHGETDGPWPASRADRGDGAAPAGAARVLIGGRNLAGPSDPAARFTMSIDGAVLQQWDAAPGFFLKVFDIPAGRLPVTVRFAGADGAVDRGLGNRRRFRRRSSNSICRATSDSCGATARAGRKLRTVHCWASGDGRAHGRHCRSPARPARSGSR